MVLRASLEADLARVVEATNDPGLQRYSQSMREHALLDESTVRGRELEHLEESAVGLSLTWSVADASTDSCLGSVVIYRIHPGREAEIGYWTHPAARGRGVATEACRLAVRHAYIDAMDGGLGLHRLTAYASVDNLASLGILKRAGFTRFGTERRSTLLTDGSYVDTAAFDLLADEFAEASQIAD